MPKLPISVTLLMRAGMNMLQSHHHQSLGMHPLDWTYHLKQQLVVDPVPTILTLLLVSAHFYSCCSPKAAAAEETGYVSFLGTLFQGTSDVMSGKLLSAWGDLIYSMGNKTLPGSECLIRTPLSSRRMARRIREMSTDYSTPETSASSTEETNNFKDALISAAMTDPMSMMYDMWWYLSSADIQLLDRPSPTPSSSPQFAETQETHQQEGSCDNNHSDSTRNQTAKQLGGDDLWTDVCIMHALGLGGVGISLAPSMLCPQSSLACSAIPGCKHSPWAVLNSCILVSGLSLVLCCAAHYLLDMPMLALCASMHSVCRILVGYASMCVSCPLPPVVMPGVAASGMVGCVGLLLLFVSRISMNEFYASEFYMWHGWACCAAMLLMRHTAFRVAVGCTSALVQLGWGAAEVKD